jgi:type IV secretory pathway TrbD component
MMKSNFKKIWFMPLLLSMLILFGLLAALLGIGLWYWLAWAAMIIPLVIICAKVWKPAATAKRIK